MREDKYKVNFPKKRWKCTKCVHKWREFIPMKCPNCDALFGIVRSREAEG